MADEARVTLFDTPEEYDQHVLGQWNFYDGLVPFVRECTCEQCPANKLLDQTYANQQEEDIQQEDQQEDQQEEAD